MPSFADDFAGLRDNASDHRVRLDQPLAAASKLKRAGHVPEVEIHFFSPRSKVQGRKHVTLDLGLSTIYSGTHRADFLAAWATESGVQSLPGSAAAPGTTMPGAAAAESSTGTRTRPSGPTMPSRMKIDISASATPGSRPCWSRRCAISSATR